MKHLFESKRANRSSPAEYDTVCKCDHCGVTDCHVDFGDREDVCVKCAPLYPETVHAETR